MSVFLRVNFWENFFYFFLAFIFLFSLFRRLKVDYPPKEIALASLFGFVLFCFFYFFLSLWDWNLLLMLFSTILVVTYFSYRYHWHFWSVLESIAFFGVNFLFLARLFKVLVEFDQFFLGEVVNFFLAVVLTRLVWKNYRRFLWYPSGKIGFVFLANLLTISLGEAIVDFWRGGLVQLAVWLVLGFAALILILFFRKEGK